MYHQPEEILTALRRAAPSWDWRCDPKGCHASVTIGSCPAKVTVNPRGDAVVRLAPGLGISSLYLPFARTLDEACQALADRAGAIDGFALLAHDRMEHIRRLLRS